ncbi:YncE family protein [Aureivirga sp. CE67]|uniref:YncE family protein n=1 Tax=Aureivirga sp. CE67 TaxID=1788983 RepID=UPI0018CB91F4|nr:DUF5074 domain-containing protein [Aureivirga sp. CE67]
MNFKKISIAILASASLFFTSCSSDDDTSGPIGDYDNGMFVVNEGSFGNTPGTVSFIPYDLSEVKKDIYKTVNNEDLGSLAQSMTISNDKAYIVVNDSHVIKIANRFTFEKEGEIEEGLDNPRFMTTVAGNKAYVTNWGDTSDENDDFIAVVDLNSNTVTSTIDVELGPEKIYTLGNRVFVLHQGAWGQNDKVSVINTLDNTVEKVITVGDIPNSAVLDINGNLWVMGAGKAAWTGDETAGSLTKINTTTLEIEKTMDFASDEHPGHLNFYNNKMYYALNGGLYSLETSSESLPTQAILDGINAYGLKVGKDKIFVTDAKDYISFGSVVVYDLNTLTEEKSLEVGIIPNSVTFNQIN